MPSSDSSPPTGPRQGGHGAVAWIVFILAIASVLVLLVGCMSVLYGPLMTGG